VRVLVVEDDPMLREFLIQGLKEAGYAVDGAADGEQGLELATLATRHPYDAGRLRRHAPRRDGLSLIADLRRRGQRLPVLILSTRQSVDDRVRGLQAGGDDYLVKPFDDFRRGRNGRILP
jgi:two-component system OmpR family response regulator